MAVESAGPLNVDEELEELELRLERLRALYEQYFLGIEKIEPQVARKDVDRRIWILRREKIRNTAKRFKFQVLIQRYNTFQQYWQRVCREIENGTYQRHLVKAEKMLGTAPLTIAAKRRLGTYARRPAEEAEAAAAAEEKIRAAEEHAASAQAEAGRRELDALLGLPSTGRPATRPGPFGAPPTAPGQPSEPARPVQPAAPRAQASPDVAKAKPKLKLERLDLDIDDLLGGGSAPISQRPPRRPSVPPTSPVARASAAQKPPPSAEPKPVPPRVSPPQPPARNAPAPPPAPVRPATRPQTPPSAPATGGMSEDRVKQLHARLVDAKRKLNDPGAVSLDGLAKQLRTAEDTLRKQHGNRRIDFDVVIKDGKAVVKPILR